MDFGADSTDRETCKSWNRKKNEETKISEKMDNPKEIICKVYYKMSHNR